MDLHVFPIPIPPPLLNFITGWMGKRNETERMLKHVVNCKDTELREKWKENMDTL